MLFLYYPDERMGVVVYEVSAVKVEFCFVLSLTNTSPGSMFLMIFLGVIFVIMTLTV